MRNYYDILRVVLLAGAWVMIIMLLSSCKTCVPVVEVRDSIRIEYKLDSVYEYKHDSIYVDRYTRGDTIWITTEKWRTQYKDKIVLQHDTIRDTQTQTIVQAEKQKGFVYYCGWVLIALVCGAAFVGIAKVALKFV